MYYSIVYYTGKEYVVHFSVRISLRGGDLSATRGLEATVGSKYEALARHLLATEGDSLRTSFKEVEEIVGELPHSARKHRAW